MIDAGFPRYYLHGLRYGILNPMDAAEAYAVERDYDEEGFYRGADDAPDQS